MGNYKRIFDLVTELTGHQDWSTRAYIQITGDPLAGMFLSQIVWYSDKTKREDGFFYKTANEWEDELCLSYAQIKRLETKLADMGLIEVKKEMANKSPTMHYKPVMQEIENSIKLKFKKVQFQESSISNNSNPQIQESSISITETTTETITPNGVKPNQKPKKQSRRDKPRTQLSQEFTRLTGIPEPENKPDNKFWWSSINRFFEVAQKDVDIGLPLMRETILDMKSDELTISDPNSIIKTARSKMGNGFGKTKGSIVLG